MRKFICLLLLLLVACKKVDKAPPITEGKCKVLQYEGRVATKQVCLFEGYRWDCGMADCSNAGEATGEK